MATIKHGGSGPAGKEQMQVHYSACSLSSCIESKQSEKQHLRSGKPCMRGGRGAGGVSNAALVCPVSRRC